MEFETRWSLMRTLTTAELRSADADLPFAGTPPLLSIVVPTFNERDNVRELIFRVDRVLAGTAWEIIFVDDNSPDGTAALVKGISAEDCRVRCIRRVGR